MSGPNYYKLSSILAPSIVTGVSVGVKGGAVIGSFGGPVGSIVSAAGFGLGGAIIGGLVGFVSYKLGSAMLNPAKERAEEVKDLAEKETDAEEKKYSSIYRIMKKLKYAAKTGRAAAQAEAQTAEAEVESAQAEVAAAQAQAQTAQEAVEALKGGMNHPQEVKGEGHEQEKQKMKISLETQTKAEQALSAAQAKHEAARQKAEEAQQRADGHFTEYNHTQDTSGKDRGLLYELNHEWQVAQRDEMGKSQRGFFTNAAKGERLKAEYSAKHSNRVKPAIKKSKQRFNSVVAAHQNLAREEDAVKAKPKTGIAKFFSSIKFWSARRLLKTDTLVKFDEASLGASRVNFFNENGSPELSRDNVAVSQMKTRDGRENIFKTLLSMDQDQLNKIEHDKTLHSYERPTARA